MIHKFYSTFQKRKAPVSTRIPSESKYILIIISLIVLLVCGFYLSFAWNRYQKAASSEALQLAQSLASIFHSEHIAELSGDPGDIEKPEYIMTKRSLFQFVGNNNTIQFAYLLGEKNGNIIFLLDAETPDSPDYLPPGQVYTESKITDWQPLLNGEAMFAKPITDRQGSWISVLAPIKDVKDGSFIAVLGIDYPASKWQLMQWKHMVPDIIIVLCILIIHISFTRIWIQHLKLKILTNKLILDEALYHSVFNQAPLGIAIVNENSFVSQSELGEVNINPMCEHILGRTSQELNQQKWAEITHHEDLQADLEKFEQFKKGEISGYSMEKRFIRPDGLSIWTNMKISSLTGFPNDNLHLCLLEDISTRKAMEGIIRERDRSNSLLLSHLPGLAYRAKYDREGTMQIVSDGCYKLTGYLPECFIENRDLAFNNIIKPEHRESLLKEWERTIPNRLQYEQEYQITTANGESKWVLEIGEGVCDERGEIEALEGLILDISDRKKAEEKLIQSLERTQSMVNNHQAVMLLIEPLSGNIVEANNSASRFYGYSKEELLNMKIQDINTLNEDESVELNMKILHKKQMYFTFRHRMKNGEVKTVDVYSSPIEYSGEIAMSLT